MISNRKISSQNVCSESPFGNGKELIFQFGIEKDLVLFEGNSIEALRELAETYIENKVKY